MTEPQPSELFHDAAGCHWGGRPHRGACRDRSREAGRALTELRTVLSRAETARRMLTTNSSFSPQTPLERPRLPKPPTPAGMGDTGEPPYDPDGAPFDDPDHEMMLAALDQVVMLLWPWHRNGRTTHWVADTGAAQLVDARPPWYDAEVGDEMFMGGQAVLAEVRGRLAAHFGYDAATARTVLGVVDEYVRELVNNERDGEVDNEDGDAGVFPDSLVTEDRCAECQRNKGKPHTSWCGLSKRDAV